MNITTFARLTEREEGKIKIFTHNFHNKMDITLGLILIIVGILLLIAEAAVPGFFVAIPGGVFLVLGLIALAFPQMLYSLWTPLIVVLIIIPLTFASIKFYQKISPPTKPTTTMSSSLVGKEGKVINKVVRDELQGKVKIDNQMWSATADKEIEEGTWVVVTESKGVHVVVREKKR